jgi:signal transduction histidine kinase
MDRSLRILMLEDNETDAQLVLRELRKGGVNFEASRAATREEYTAALERQPPELILADYGLPAFDGLSALAIAQRVCPEVPFVFVSGVLGEERAIETLKRGATDYVLKDRLARLVPAVQRALEEAEERTRRREAEARVQQRTAELEAANAQLSAHRAQLRALSRRLVEQQEAQSRAVSRNLHDETGQGMAALKIGLGLLQREAGCTEAMRARIDELRQTADEVQEGLHRLAVNLRPSSLDRYGLVPALKQFIGAFRERNALDVEFLASGLDEERLDGDVETALYRIVQEGLTNVARHAHATRVGVIANREGKDLRLILEDDGCGFDPDEALGRGRLGLLGMRERAEMLGGTLTIESWPERGTTVFVQVPVRVPDE